MSATRQHGVIDAYVGAERLPVVPISAGIGLLGAPPLGTNAFNYGDVVRLVRRDGRMDIDGLVRRSRAKSYRFNHAIADRGTVAKLLEDIHWANGFARATGERIVVAIPEEIDPVPILEKLAAAGVKEAREKTRTEEIFA